RLAPSRSPWLKSKRLRFAPARLHFGQSLPRPAKRSSAGSGSAALPAIANASRSPKVRTGRRRFIASLEIVLDRIEAGLGAGLVVLRRRAADPDAADVHAACRHNRQTALDDRD